MNKYLLLALLISTFSWSQKPIFATAKVKSATVYFNAVELHQTASINLPAGSSEIVLKGIADDLNQDTVQIGAPSTVTVLSVQYSDDYISEYEIDKSNPKIKAVNDSIILLKKEILKLTNLRSSEIKTIELLDRNQQVYGLNSGLNVLELTKMVDYYKQKRTESNNNINLLDEKSIKLNNDLVRLNKKLDTNTQKEEKSSDGKLILQIMNTVAGNVALEVSYLSNAASWKPFYDLRANNIASPINMMYKAQVTQNTGIDWKKVKLSLSSGNPNQSNKAPILESWFLRYRPENNYQDDMKDKFMITRNDKREEKAMSSMSLQEVVVTSVKSTITNNQLNVSFDIDLPYDILSNNKPHSVALSEIKIPANYKYYAAPRIDKDAFLMAEINDYSKYNLLRGEANIIFEGMYVGKTIVDANQTTDTLSLSMGRDKKIAIKREKIVDKSGIKFLSSFKEQIFTFDITVRNNKKETISIVIEDQYPLSPDKDIEIQLLQSDKAKVNAETGILTWDLNLAAAETKKIRVSYKVKYPKDRIIDNL